MQTDFSDLPVDPCLPWDTNGENCCYGLQKGELCNESSECLGRSWCFAGRCVGEDQCDGVCNKQIGNRSVRCCVPHKEVMDCASDDDCNGIQICNSVFGVCTGPTGCEGRSPSKPVIYDRRCLCRDSASVCAYTDGIPCAHSCKLTETQNAIECRT